MHKKKKKNYRRKYYSFWLYFGCITVIEKRFLQIIKLLDILPPRSIALVHLRVNTSLAKPTGCRRYTFFFFFTVDGKRRVRYFWDNKFISSCAFFFFLSNWTSQSTNTCETFAWVSIYLENGRKRARSSFPNRSTNVETRNYQLSIKRPLNRHRLEIICLFRYWF